MLSLSELYNLSSGANAGSDTRTFAPQPTSYDYDAPLSEAGDYRPKYYAIMDVIAKYAPIPKVTRPPAPQKYAYGKVLMTKVILLKWWGMCLAWGEGGGILP